MGAVAEDTSDAVVERVRLHHDGVEDRVAVPHEAALGADARLPGPPRRRQAAGAVKRLDAGEEGVKEEGSEKAVAVEEVQATTSEVIEGSSWAASDATGIHTAIAEAIVAAATPAAAEVEKDARACGEREVQLECLVLQLQNEVGTLRAALASVSAEANVA